MYSLFSSKKQIHVIQETSITITYSEYGTSTSKTFTFNLGDVIEGSSTSVASGMSTYMIIHKIDGKKYKVTFTYLTNSINKKNKVKR